MQLNLAYRGRSAVTWSPAGLAVALAPNLRRDRVSFEGVLRDPLHFREAVGALHDVVVSDLRYKPRDHSAYEAYKAQEQRREAELRKTLTQQARAAIHESLPELPEPYTAELEKRYRRLCSTYWKKRLEYSNFLMKHDPELWRLLVPCDPVITIAPDCLFFECFSADESSYGCLTVERSAFDREQDVALGTTNVDYSWTLYEHFQRMRSYRETRFLVDPAGFEVQAGTGDGYREEKIELPPSWLRGFLQLQAAMSLPMRRVPVGREGLYNILAYLKRHRAARSPRAVRFELEPARPTWAVLEPWGQRVRLGDAPYDGPRSEIIRTWGRDRLQLLARLLPLLESAEVYLLGTGLPSFWSIRMGPLRLILGLSGWTANDWTRASALDQLAPPAEPDPATMTAIAHAFHTDPALSFDRLRTLTGAQPPALAVGLNRLALLGQVIHDLPAGLYRWRQIMPVTLSAEVIGPEHPETAAARQLVAGGTVKVSRDETRPDGLRVLEGRVMTTEASLLLDGDGRMLRGRCSCSYHFTGGLRRGPCRHLQALRDAANAATAARPTASAWYAALWN
ncbi:MAG TPA: hypothetical protein VFF52_05290 [Isosphaeraceae bacterium]|nr:hypothetical protein [Isosphaeraceae bacterium]